MLEMYISYPLGIGILQHEFETHSQRESILSELLDYVKYGIL